MEIPGKLTLPALRAYMGDWVYYTAAMSLSDVAARISIAELIHKSATLKELIQRTLDESKHASQISNYLLRDKQRLFNSLVVGLYGGSPEWYELKLRQTGEIDPEFATLKKSGMLGFLTLTGQEKLFALDGQHRVAGIKQAVAHSAALGREEVSVIFVAHHSDTKGLERTRRLFTRLNRFAKPVRKEEIIALDEDDSVAILTRQFVDDESQWRNKVSLHKTKAMPVSDQKSITTIGTIYDVLDVYLGSSREGWTEYKRMRPSDRELKLLMREAKGLWKELAKAFPRFGQALGANDSSTVVPHVRSQQGGEIIFRPIGLEVIVRTIANLRKGGLTLKKAAAQISKVKMNLEDAPWAGILWNTAKSRMLSGSDNKKSAQLVLYWLAGGHLASIKYDEMRLQSELEGVLNKAPGTVDLPTFKRNALR